MRSILKQQEITGISRINPFIKVNDVRNLRIFGDNFSYEPFGEPKTHISGFPAVSAIKMYKRFYVSSIYDSSFVPIQSTKSGEMVDCIVDASNKIYLSKNFGESGNAGWYSEWIDKLEVEGPITTGSSTTSSSLYADSSTPLRYASSNFYYRGWYAHVRLSAKSNLVVTAKVLDYNSSTGELKLESGAIAGVTAGTDVFWLSRTLYNGYGGNTVTFPNGTIFSDYHLDGIRIWFDDTDYWPNTYNYIITGIDKPMFHGSEYIRELYLSVEQFPKPWLAIPTTDEEPVLTNVSASGTSGSLESGTWLIAIAYIYDGFQVGRISDGLSFSVSAGNDRIDFSLNIPLTASYVSSSGKYIRVWDTSDVPNHFSVHLIDRRITGINIYLSPPSSDGYFLARTIIFSTKDVLSRSEFGTTSPGYYPLAGYGTNSTILEDDWNANKNIVYKNTLNVSYSYSVIAGGLKFVSSPRTEDKQTLASMVMFSNVDDDGTINVDSIGAENVINLSSFVNEKITRLFVFREPSSGVTESRSLLVVVTDKDVVLIDVNTQNPIDWRLRSTLQNDGSLATNGFTFFNGAMFYFASGKRYMMFDGNVSREIGLGLGDQHRSIITNEKDCLGFYDSEKRLVGFLHPTDKVMVLFDFANGINDRSLNFPSIIDIDSGIVGYDQLYNGCVYYNNNSIFYFDTGFRDLSGSTREAKLDISINSFSTYFLLNALACVYKSDTGLLIDVYDDGAIVNTITFPNSSDIKSEFKYIDASRRYKNMRIVIRSKDESVNTIFNFVDILADVKQDKL